MTPRTTLIAMALLLGAGCAATGPEGRMAAPAGLKPVADPSAVIAAELAFARAAQGQGQWTAFRATATPDAVLFVPERVRAQDWLKGRADPARSVRWQPHAAWVACDGSAGVTTGAAQWPPMTAGGAEGQGMFTTVWIRQRDGGYRWQLDHGAAVAAPRAAPDAIRARVAACDDPPGNIVVTAPQEGEDALAGASRDRTLQWHAVVRPDGARTLTVRLWDGTALVPVLVDRVAPGGETLIEAAP